MLCMKHVLLHTNMQLASVCEYKPIWCNFAYFQYCIPPRKVSSPVEQLSCRTTNRRHLVWPIFECVSKRATVLLFVVAVGQSKGNWRQTRWSLSKVYSRDRVWRICDLLHKYKSFQCPTMLWNCYDNGSIMHEYTINRCRHIYLISFVGNQSRTCSIKNNQNLLMHCVKSMIPISLSGLWSHHCHKEKTWWTSLLRSLFLFVLRKKMWHLETTICFAQIVEFVDVICWYIWIQSVQYLHI